MTGHRDESGITLIEVVIAMVILGAMGVLALEAFRAGAGAWDRTERRAEADQRLRVTHDLLARELALLEPVAVKIDGRHVTGFRGWTEQLFFYAAPNTAAVAPFSGLVRRVSLSVEPGMGLVLREGWPLVDGLAGLEPGASMRVLDPRVAAMRVRYLAPPDKEVALPHWIEDWDPVERFLNSVKLPGGTSANTTLVPSTIELTLTVSEERGPRTRQFLFPIRTGRYVL